MTPIRLFDFACDCGGEVFGADRTSFFEGFSWDSREVANGSLFLAIKGEHFDGHDFCAQALESGASACLVERPIEGPHVLVKSVTGALASFAEVKREDFDGPVIGITGSNGKTSTKEFTASAVSSLGDVLKTPGNYNSEITSPLIWADLTAEHRAAVIEMGMRGFGQIDHLCRFTKPTIGIITGIGTSHAEKVGSRAGIAKAKGELLENLPASGKAILWREDDFYNDLVKMAPCEALSFGHSPEADCRVIGHRMIDWTKSVVLLQIGGNQFEVCVQAIGKHQALNVAAGVLAATAAGVPAETAARDAQKAVLPPMRLETIERDGVTIVVDTYNASPDSTVAAIRTLAEAPSTGKKYAVLGEMKELGDFEESGHRLVGKELVESQLDRVLLCGGATAYIRAEAEQRGFPDSKFESTEAVEIETIKRFIAGCEPGDTVLIKGSRALGLERAVSEVHA